MQSENIIQVLQVHQQKVKQSKIKEIQERKLKKEQEAPEDTDQGNVYLPLKPPLGYQAFNTSV